MSLNIKNLTLDDLFKPAKSGDLPKPSAPSKEEREALIRQAAEAQRAKARQSPWQASRLVLWVNEVICKSCGDHHYSPATRGLTVEFTHKKHPGQRQYVSRHPSQGNPNLPVASEYRVEHVTCCQECFPEITLHSEIHSRFLEEGI